MSLYKDDSGFRFVRLKGKKAYDTGWTKPGEGLFPSQCGGGNIGIHHLDSGTCTLDIDHDLAASVFEAVGLDLQQIIDNAKFSIIGNPSHPPKPIFRMPHGFVLSRVALAFHDPLGTRTKSGSPGGVTIFELRGGAGSQDVFPPSIHPDTQQPYQWRDGVMPASVGDLPELPADLLALWRHWERIKPNLEELNPWQKKATPKKKSEGKDSESQAIIDKVNELDSRDIIVKFFPDDYIVEKRGDYTGNKQPPGLVFYKSGLMQEWDSDAPLYRDGKGFSNFGAIMRSFNDDYKKAMDAARDLVGAEPFKPKRQDDDPTENATKEGKAKAHALNSEPLPLQADLERGEPYPVDALGEVLGGAAKAIQAQTLAPLGMCCQSVLAVASLAAQGLVKVSVGGRFECPASLFLLALGESGERKSSVDRMASKAVRDYQRSLHDQYINELGAYQAEMQKWRELSPKERAESAPPEQPSAPYFLADEPTYEAIVKTLNICRPSAALLTDEGAAFLSGHSMQSERRIRTTVGIAKLWDGSEISRSRAGDGNIMLYERAFCCYLMIQPALAQKLMLGDADMNEQGLLARFLITYPESTISTRFIENERETAASHEFNKYYSVIKTLLELISFHPITHELDRRTLNLDRTAWRCWINFYNEVEAGQVTDGLYAEIKATASKAPEQAARIASVLHVVEHPNDGLITLDTMQRAITLAKFYLGESLRLFGNGARDEKLSQAGKLAEWFRDAWIPGKVKKPERDNPYLVTTREVVAGAARIVRKKTAVARELLNILAAHNWVRNSEESKNIWIVEPCINFQSASTTSTRQQQPGKPHSYKVFNVDAPVNTASTFTEADTAPGTSTQNVDAMLTGASTHKTAAECGFQERCGHVDVVDGSGVWQVFVNDEPAYPPRGSAVVAKDDLAVACGFKSWSEMRRARVDGRPGVVLREVTA
jgi:hypothetical protein